MAKFSGLIGYATEMRETSPGVWDEEIIEKKSFGDILRNNRKLENGENIHDDLKLNNQISIVADPYARNHFFSLRYVNWMGANWKVTNVEVQLPRLILTIGGVYHGQTNEST